MPTPAATATSAGVVVGQSANSLPNDLIRQLFASLWSVLYQMAPPPAASTPTTSRTVPVVRQFMGTTLKGCAGG